MSLSGDVWLMLDAYDEICLLSCFAAHNQRDVSFHVVHVGIRHV